MQSGTEREAHRVYERRYREKLKSDSERLAKKRAATKAWREANPEKKTLYSRNKVAATRKNKPWLLAFKSARRRSYKYGMAFTLTQDWVASQFDLGSAISGLPFSQGMGPFSASIDRIDSELDYVPENCRLILLAENLFKNQWDDAVIIEISKAIAARDP